MGAFFMGVFVTLCVEIVVVAWVTAIKSTREIRRMVEGSYEYWQEQGRKHGMGQD